MVSTRSSESDIDDHSIREFAGHTEEQQAPRRQSFIRRLSSAASFNTAESHPEFNDSITGSASIYRALSRKRGSSVGQQSAGQRSRAGSMFDVLESDVEAEGVEVFARAEGQAGGGLPVPEPPVAPKEFDHKYGVNAMVFSVGKTLRIWDDTADKGFFAQMMVGFKNYFILIVAMLLLLSIYWGSYYKRPDRYNTVHYPVYIADEGVPEENIPNVIGQIVEYFFTNVSTLDQIGSFDIQNMTEFTELAASHNITVEEEVYRQVYHEKAYAAIVVHRNATRLYFENLQGEGSLPKDTLMEIVLETGRDYNTMVTLVLPLMQNVNKVFRRYISQTSLWTILTENLDDEQLTGLIAQSPDLLTSIPTFRIYDMRPIPAVIYQAPLVLGVLYLCVFAFFQFLFTVPLNAKVAMRIKGFKFIIYKFFTSQIAYIVISLSYVLLNTAFGMAYDKTFGNSGFLVIWMFGYLVMAALGSVIEVLVLLVVPERIHLVGLILVGTIVLNLAPTLAGLAFSPKFYKYGYAMPVYQAYKLMHIAYFNTWKGHIGRHIGVLCAWIVLANTILPFVIVRAAKKVSAMKQAAANSNANAKRSPSSAENSSNDITESEEKEKLNT